MDDRRRLGCFALIAGLFALFCVAAMIDEHGVIREMEGWRSAPGVITKIHGSSNRRSTRTWVHVSYSVGGQPQELVESVGQFSGYDEGEHVTVRYSANEAHIAGDFEARFNRSVALAAISTLASIALLIWRAKLRKKNGAPVSSPAPRKQPTSSRSGRRR